jgi:soluble lytic murein transglycosylase-like protein
MAQRDLDLDLGRGAIGLMQLQPATATRYGVKNIYDPEQNVRAVAAARASVFTASLNVN